MDKGRDGGDSSLFFCPEICNLYTLFLKANLTKISYQGYSRSFLVENSKILIIKRTKTKWSLQRTSAVGNISRASIGGDSSAMNSPSLRDLLYFIYINSTHLP